MALEPIEHLTDGQIEDLCAMYQLEWWTRGRELSDVRRMLQHSDVIVSFCDSETKRLVAFARVLTDYVYKALVLDMVVESAQRGQGLGRALMDAIVDHPSLKCVRDFELYCLPEMVLLYKKWGFTEDLGQLRFMRRTRPEDRRPSA